MAEIGLKYIQQDDPWCMLDYPMTQPDVQEATIRPFFPRIGQENNRHDPLVNAGLNHD